MNSRPIVFDSPFQRLVSNNYNYDSLLSVSSVSKNVWTEHSHSPDSTHAGPEDIALIKI